MNKPYFQKKKMAYEWTFVAQVIRKLQIVYSSHFLLQPQVTELCKV